MRFCNNRKDVIVMRKAYSFRLFQVQMKVLIILSITSALAIKSTASGGVNNGAMNSAAVSPARQEQTASLSASKSMVHPEVPRIPAKDVKEMLEKKADFVIVDTNPEDFFKTWHIPTAINIPYIVLADNPGKRERMLGILPKDKLIVLYCLCEEGADSSEVALMLRKMNYRRDQVKVLEGGLVKWDEKKYPMIKTEIPE
jgi:rhodanese-related sulfurtransferase